MQTSHSLHERAEKVSLGWLIFHVPWSCLPALLTQLYNSIWLHPLPLHATQNVPWCIPNNACEAWISVYYLILFYYDFNFMFVLWSFLFLSARLHNLIVSHWYFVAVRFGHINIQALGIIILWNQVTLKTSLPARYCTLLKVWDCCMNEVMAARMINHGSSAWVTLCPPFCILFYPDCSYAISEF